MIYLGWDPKAARTTTMPCRSGGGQRISSNKEIQCAVMFPGGYVTYIANYDVT